MIAWILAVTGWIEINPKVGFFLNLLVPSVTLPDVRLESIITLYLVKCCSEHHYANGRLLVLGCNPIHKDKSMSNL